MLRSRSSVGGRSLHCVSRSVEGQLIRAIMGEVKEWSSWGGTNVSILLESNLIRVTRVKTQCRESWFDIAIPWRLVSVECDEHLHLLT